MSDYIDVEDPPTYSRKVSVYLAEKPELLALSTSKVGILQSFWENILKWGRLTEKQEVVAFRILREQEARAEAERVSLTSGSAKPVPVGIHRLVDGVVALVKIKDSQWGVTYKMRVESSEGWAVWASIPKKYQPHAEWDDPNPLELKVGDHVRFIAGEIAPSDSALYGFVSRPSRFVVSARAVTPTAV